MLIKKDFYQDQHPLGFVNDCILNEIYIFFFLKRVSHLSLIKLKGFLGNLYEMASISEGPPPPPKLIWSPTSIKHATQQTLFAY